MRPFESGLPSLGIDTPPVSSTVALVLAKQNGAPDSLVLVMYAENLGSIPPNTGLLVVRDGEAVYDVRFRADLQSNAAIILRRRRRQ